MAGIREWYPELPSTQDRAVALAREGAEEGTRVVAGRQRAGRGRHGHSWESPDGGLYLSIVLGASEGRTTLFPIALSAALASELGENSSVPLRVRWPNDLLAVSEAYPPQKLGGILADEVPSPRLGRAWVAGIGINVTTPRAALSAELRPRVATLSELGFPHPNLEAIEGRVVRAALRTASLLRSPDGVAELRGLARRLLWGSGRTATIDGRPVGTIDGLGESGELWVEDRGTRRAFWSGILEVGDAPREDLPSSENEP